MSKQKKAEKAEQKGSNAERDHNRDQMERQKTKAKGRDAERSHEREQKEGW